MNKERCRWLRVHNDASSALDTDVATVALFAARH
jgi:hypothetical protein